MPKNPAMLPRRSSVHIDALEKARKSRVSVFDDVRNSVYDVDRVFRASMFHQIDCDDEDATPLLHLLDNDVERSEDDDSEKDKEHSEYQKGVNEIEQRKALGAKTPAEMQKGLARANLDVAFMREQLLLAQAEIQRLMALTKPVMVDKCVGNANTLLGRKSIAVQCCYDENRGLHQKIKYRDQVVQVKVATSSTETQDGPGIMEETRFEMGIQVDKDELKKFGEEDVEERFACAARKNEAQDAMAQAMAAKAHTESMLNPSVKFQEPKRLETGSHTDRPKPSPTELAEIARKEAERRSSLHNAMQEAMAARENTMGSNDYDDYGYGNFGGRDDYGYGYGSDYGYGGGGYSERDKYGGSPTSPGHSSSGRPQSSRAYR
jgi:hypothetical protein